MNTTNDRLHPSYLEFLKRQLQDPKWPEAKTILDGQIYRDAAVAMLMTGRAHGIRRVYTSSESGTVHCTTTACASVFLPAFMYRDHDGPVWHRPDEETPTNTNL